MSLSAKIKVLSILACNFGVQNTFQKRIVPKSLRIDQDNLHMKKTERGKRKERQKKSKKKEKSKRVRDKTYGGESIINLTHFDFRTLDSVVKTVKGTPVPGGGALVKIGNFLSRVKIWRA